MKLLSIKIPASLFFVQLLFLSSCHKEQQHDGSGAFEAVTTIVAAQANGTISQLDIEEGENVRAGQYIGYIDSTQEFLKKRQLLAESGATLSKQPDIHLQTAALEEQLIHAQKELDRTTSLVNADAATVKQQDDAKAEVALIERQIAAERSSLQTTTVSLQKATSPIAIQIAQINDQLDKCKIISPVTGTILTKYVEPHELATIGKPLFKIANLDYLNLRAYITGDQLKKIHLQQVVDVFIDEDKEDKDKGKRYTGIVTWISEQSEFTPKSIQTKDERANQVYAVKIKVKNDGNLKIGQYGAINFQSGSNVSAATKPSGSSPQNAADTLKH